MKRYIKEHKAVVVAVILMLIIIVIAFLAKQAFFSNSKNAVYGNRLEGIDAVEIDSKKQKEIINHLKDDSAVKESTYELQGKIINIIITVNDDVGLDTAKSLAGKVLEKLDDNQKKFYDIQIFIKKENGGSDFPIIGYKHSNKENFSWTKDRVAE